jgi:uncharacterized protein
VVVTVIASRRPWLRVLAALSWAAGLVSAAPVLAQQLVEVPALEAPVTDLTGTLTSDQVAALDARLRAFEASRGSQIAVLLVPTTEPEAIEQFAIRVADAWKLGRKGVDDGAILVVARNDRKLRIEVGYGLEGALPDAIANRIIDEDIVPQFRRGDYYAGITAGVDRMTRVIEGEPLPEPESGPPAQGAPGLFQLLPFLFVFALVGSAIFRRLLGRVGGAFASGGLMGLLTWFMVHILGIALAAGIVVFVFVLLGGLGGGGRGPGGSGWYSRRHGGGWGHPGGFGGGWSGRGGGCGGGARRRRRFRSW